MENLPKCVVCDTEMHDVRSHRRFCSPRCKGRWWRKNPHAEPVKEHTCRQCQTVFPISRGQNNKWLCSDACRKSANAESVRNFHKRRPLMEAIYRKRTHEKMPTDSQNVRFYRLNPTAPRACEGCGEDRVTEIAHRLGHERLGQRRTSANLVWPEKVWVLCPTCHRLLDRMKYSPEDLGLK